MYKQFAVLFQSFGKISPNSAKGYQVYQCNRYNLLWYKSIHTIYRSFQDVLGYNIIKLGIVYANANIYIFCKLNLKYHKLEKTSKIQILIQSTIATHSTIASRQCREFLTFHSSVVLALLMFISQFMSLWLLSITPFRPSCGKTVLEVLRHAY